MSTRQKNYPSIEQDITPFVVETALVTNTVVSSTITASTSVTTGNITMSGDITTVDLESTGSTSLNDVNITGVASGITIEPLFKVGSFTTPTAAGTLEVTGVGFKPITLQFVSLYPTLEPSGSIDTLGASDGTTEFCVSIDSNDTQSTTSYAIWKVTSNNTVTEERAVVQSFDEDGFTLDFDISDGQPRTFGYIAYG